jgi:hypothetical protein
MLARIGVAVDVIERDTDGAMQAPALTCPATPPAPSASRQRSEAGACPVARLPLSTVCERLCGRIPRAWCGRAAVVRRRTTGSPSLPRANRNCSGLRSHAKQIGQSMRIGRNACLTTPRKPRPGVEKRRGLSCGAFDPVWLPSADHSRTAAFRRGRAVSTRASARRPERQRWTRVRGRSQSSIRGNEPPTSVWSWAARVRLLERGRAGQCAVGCTSPHS